MALSLADVEHIAGLARLALSEVELKLFREQLSAILDYAAQLQSLDTSQVVPTSSVLSMHSALRIDISQPGLDRESLMKTAPRIEAGQFYVPPVLE